MKNDNFANFVDELKQKCNIVDVLSRYIQLKKKGMHHWAKCPFHNESDASFAVSEIKGTYNCFGCGVHGDIFSFVMAMEHCGFMDAVKILADKAGISVPEFHKDGASSDNAKKKDRLYGLMRDCAVFYVNSLAQPTGAIAREYIEKRGLTTSTVRNFGIGHSPGYDELPNHLKGKGYTSDEMLECGVCGVKNNKVYDALAGRLIVPIINNFGKVIAFGGRALGNTDFGKYKNTQETVLFQKRTELFGFTNLKKAKLDGTLKQGLIIVEGYMDVISLCQAGITNVCASMGTAFTPQHLKTLKFFSNKIYLCYDGDGAGQKAILKAIEILKDQDFNVKVITLPNKLDPDDVIKQLGKDKFQEMINSAISPTEYQIRFIKAEVDTSDPAEQGKFAIESIKILDGLNSVVEKEAYLPLIRDLSGLTMDSIRKEFFNRNKIESTSVTAKKVTIISQTNKVDAELERYNRASRYVLKALCQYKHDYDYINDDLSSFFNLEDHKKIYGMARANSLSGQTLSIDDLANMEDNSEAELIRDMDINQKGIDKEKFFSDSVKALKTAYYILLKDRLISDITQETDANAVAEMKKLLMKVTMQIKSL